jgi:hypothetical protein
LEHVHWHLLLLQLLCMALDYLLMR